MSDESSDEDNDPLSYRYSDRIYIYKIWHSLLL